MAKPQSTTGLRARKKHRRKRAIPAPPAPYESGVTHGGRPYPQDRQLEGPQQTLIQAIEAERSRLTTAQSILGCLREALVASEQRHHIDCDYADVATIAQQLVREAIHRLDLVFLSPFIEAFKGRTGRYRRRRPLPATEPAP